MPKYTVVKENSVTSYVEVEADTPEQAHMVACDEFFSGPDQKPSDKVDVEDTLMSVSVFPGTFDEERPTDEEPLYQVDY